MLKAVAQDVLYEGLLGPRVADLPPRIRRLHTEGSYVVATGRFVCGRGEGPGRLTILRDRGREIWYREFGGRRIATTQSAGPDGTLVERVWRLDLRFRLCADGSGLRFVHLSSALIVGGRVVRLPRWIGPRIEARVWMEGDDVRVRVVAWLAGLVRILRYQGVVEEVRYG